MSGLCDLSNPKLITIYNVFGRAQYHPVPQIFNPFEAFQATTAHCISGALYNEPLFIYWKCTSD